MAGIDLGDARKSRSLGARLKAGDHDAVQEIVDVYGARLLGCMRLIVHNEDVAEDLLQDVLVSAYTKRGQLTDPARLESWLFTMARNAALREIGKARHRHERTEDPDVLRATAVADAGRTATTLLQEQRASAILHAALQDLDDRRRELMALRYFSDLSLKEIAEVLQMPIGTVGTTLVRTLELLKKRLEAHGLTAEDLLP